MTITLTRYCAPGDNPNPACHADFTINGRPGHQKLTHDETVCLEAVYQHDNAIYDWEVVNTPPDAAYVLTKISLYEARLLLPQPGAYVVQLSMTHGDCHAQMRYILWVLTPRLLYSIPATNEPLRFNGKAEWAGDLARLMLEVDRNLPTDAERAAMDRANRPGAGNPFATIDDLPLPSGTSPETLTHEQLAAIRLANQPSGKNPFLTEHDLHEKPKLGVTPAQKDALDIADNPSGENPFITQSRLPIGVSREQKQALNAADSPNSENPYVTQSQLPLGVTHNQKEALDKADDPSAKNPFATISQLPRGITAEQNDALDKADNPSAGNPFATISQLPRGITAEQNDALDKADNPSAENPFVTKSQLPSHWSTGVTLDQKEALNHADSPNAKNPFITKSQLPLGVTPEQNDALDKADNPSAKNPFVTKSQVPLGVTCEQNEALDKADTPSAENPFVTKKQLPLGVTPEQKAALEMADHPNGANPYVTESRLTAWTQLPGNIVAGLLKADDPKASNPFVTEKLLPEIPDAVGLTPLQDQALDAAEKQDPPYKPGTNNPFVTLNQLPIGLTPLQNEALDAAEACEPPHKPGKNNPFVTLSQLPIGLTPLQNEALDAAEACEPPHQPSKTNPFVTQSKLPKGDLVTKDELPIGVTQNQRDALDAAEAKGPLHTPSTKNPFITQSALPKGDLVTKDELPIGVTEQQKAALDATPHPPSQANPYATLKDIVSVPGSCDLTQDQCGAIQNGINEPSAANPFVTKNYLSAIIADIPSVGFLTRVVAAGNLDLSQIGGSAGKTIGGLKVVSVDLAHCLSTLSFTGYSHEAHENYIVKALPINPKADQNLRGFSIVQFVEFNPQGFVLHMAQPLTDNSVPGPCMVEVSEIITAEEHALTLEQAIHYYYKLIRDEQYAEAWPMLSAHFKQSLVPPLKTFDDYVAQWTRSGYAKVKGLEKIEASDSAATYILDLDYPKAFPERKHKIHYLFERNEQKGHSRFNYWLFVDGQQLSPPKSSLPTLKPV